MLVQYLAAGAQEEAVELKINDMKEEKCIGWILTFCLSLSY